MPQRVQKILHIVDDHFILYLLSLKHATEHNPYMPTVSKTYYMYFDLK